jgi:cytochrome b561
VGDHGFVGLALFLLILIRVWLLLSKIIRLTQNDPDSEWANNLARMLQLSFVAYCTAGAFLSLSYYDLYWQLVANSVILHTLVLKFQAENASSRNEEKLAAAPLKNPFVRRRKQEATPKA